MQEEEQVVEQKEEVLEQPVEQSEPVEVEEKKEEAPQRKDAEYNFAELRKQKDEIKRALEQERKEKQEILEILRQTKSEMRPPKESDEDESDKLGEDDLPTVKHVNKKLDKRTKPLQQEVSALKAELEELRFRARYPDMDDILTNENIETLNKQEPEIAGILSKMPNSAEKFVAAYKYIKKLLPTKVAEPEEKKKAVENSKKPMSAQAAPKQSAIGNAHIFENGLTDDLKKQLWKEMQDAKKRG